jgi:hypothetical protein
MPDLVYIGGWGRSGSTALEAELQRHNNVCGLGELCYLWERGWVRDESCACGQRFSRCPFWQDVLSVARRREPLSPRHLARLQRSMCTLPQLLRRSSRAAGRALIADYVVALDAVLVAASEVSGAAVLVDSSKQAAPLALLSLCPSVTVHVAHLVREPVGVARSWSAVKARPDSNTEQRFTARSGPVKTSLLWLAHNYGVDLLEPNLGKVVHLRQADLLRAPQEQAQQVFETLGIDAGPRGSAGDWHSVAGNPARLGQTAAPAADSPARTTAERTVQAITVTGRHRWLR